MDPIKDHPSLRESSRSSRRSKAKPMTLSRMAKDMPAAKKLKLLREREAERNQKIREEVEGWFTKFDTNGDGKLQRDELRALLTHLNPHRPPTDENLDFLIQKATAIVTFSMSLPGDKNGSNHVPPCFFGDLQPVNVNVNVNLDETSQAIPAGAPALSLVLY